MSRGPWAIERPGAEACGAQAHLAVDADQGLWRLPWWSSALEPVGS